MTDTVDALAPDAPRMLPARGRVREALDLTPDALPLVAVAGSHGKSTVAWMLHDIARAAGWDVGAWLSSGVYVNGAPQPGELGPWMQVVRAARDGALELAVQEMTAATVVAAGLPRNAYPLTVLTTLCGNNESCLLSPETRAERRALELVLGALRDDGLVVANADDYDIVELVEQRATRALYFALHPENPALQRHLQRGGTGAWLEEHMLVIGSAQTTASLLPMSAIPATLDGAMLFQQQNALAAALAAHACGVPHVAIADALARFAPDPARQPAACNLVHYNGGSIVIDAPAHIWSLRMVARGVRHKPRRRTLVVSGEFPRMRDAELHEAGRILGGLGALALLHGAPDRLLALKEGMAAAPHPPLVLTLSDEVSAIEQLLNTLGADDVGLVLVDDAEQALARLWPAPMVSVRERRLKDDKAQR